MNSTYKTPVTNTGIKEKRNILMPTKKVLALLLVIGLCFFLVACNSSDYNQAEALYAAGDYESALEIYTSLGEYEDSASKVKLCKFNIANN